MSASNGARELCDVLARSVPAAPEDGRTPNPTNDFARHLGPYYSCSMQTISLKLPHALLRQLESEARLRRVT
jgi:hypothetical protein